MDVSVTVLWVVTANDAITIVPIFIETHNLLCAIAINKIVMIPESKYCVYAYVDGN